MRRILLVLVLVSDFGSGCVDKLSEDNRACPCGDGRTCCNGTCIPTGSACTFHVEATIGFAGGTLTGGDGTELVIPPGVLHEDRLVSMTSAPAITPNGYLLALGPPVILEPANLAFDYPSTVKLTMPYDFSLIPVGSSLGANLHLYGAPSGSPVFTLATVQDTEIVDSTRLMATIDRLVVYMPAFDTEPDTHRCVWHDWNDAPDICGAADAEVDGHAYAVSCPRTDDWLTTCSCVKDGVEVATVVAPCAEFDPQLSESAWQMGCNFPCETVEHPDAARPPDANLTPDAAPEDAPVVDAG